MPWLKSIVNPNHNRKTSSAKLVKSESADGMKSFLNMPQFSAHSRLPAP